MATTRINIKKNQDGRCYLESDKKNINNRIVENSNNGRCMNIIVYASKNGKPLVRWTIDMIDGEGIIVHSFSNSNPKKDSLDERIKKFPFKEGSLFLVNQSYDWYTYFREERKQKFFDKYNINRALTIPDTVTVNLPYLNGVSQNPILYLDGYEIMTIKQLPQEVTDKDEDGNEIHLSQIDILFKRIKDQAYILQVSKDKNNCNLMVAETCKTENLVTLKPVPRIIREKIQEIETAISK